MSLQLTQKQRHFLSDLKQLLEFYNATLTYTASDDGIHVIIDNEEIDGVHFWSHEGIEKILRNVNKEDKFLLYCFAMSKFLRVFNDNPETYSFVSSREHATKFDTVELARKFANSTSVTDFLHVVEFNDLCTRI